METIMLFSGIFDLPWWGYVLVVLGFTHVTVVSVTVFLHRCQAHRALDRYGHGAPDDWLERNVYTRHSVLGIGFMMIIEIVLFGPIGITIWAVQMAWIPFWGAGVINGIGHYSGYRNWSTEDASSNIVPWGLFIGGEELHNNHHAFATSAKLSSKWYEIDLGWMYISLLEALGLAQVKKVAPTPGFTDAQAVVDSETLQAVITHRYDVLAKYAKSL